MRQNVTQKLISNHLVAGQMKVNEEIALKIDQTLTQDATGTTVMLELEAMGLEYVKTELSAQYVDHNLLQTDYKNADDHLFLRSACKKFGVWFSPPGNGISHPVHMERFGVPGKTLLGSDSHTSAAGAMGMLAIGAGGLEVAMAMAGEPFYFKMPEIWGIKLTGKLPDWVSAKDIILEMLRRYGVSGGVGKIIEYYGSGLDNLTAMDRHVIANMGAELGATTTVFPSDQAVKKFLKSQEREDAWVEIVADSDAHYDEYAEIDLSRLCPLIAVPCSPGNVVPVSEVAGRQIYQAYIGSSANPGLRDFAVVAMMVGGKPISEGVSLDVNPSSLRMIENLMQLGHLGKLVCSGARIHQAGCNGCIGMGQAPAGGRISLRTVPRNFPGRSGTKEDQVYLCSPETAAAAALTGVITDPRDLDMPYPKFEEPQKYSTAAGRFSPPLSPEECKKVELLKGKNIHSLPVFEPLKETIIGPVLLKLGDDVSTDEIMPAGERVLPYRSNIPAISKFVFYQVDENYYQRAIKHREMGSLIVAGKNYGQGSSREHAALAPRYLGVSAIIAVSFARIHWQNLVNFGILPLTFIDPEEKNNIEAGDTLEIPDVRTALYDEEIPIVNKTKNRTWKVRHTLTKRQIEIMSEGGMINLFRKARSKAKE